MSVQLALLSLFIWRVTCGGQKDGSEGGGPGSQDDPDQTGFLELTGGATEDLRPCEGLQRQLQSSMEVIGTGVPLLCAILKAGKLSVPPELLPECGKRVRFHVLQPPLLTLRMSRFGDFM
ncbi:hypothetical protein STEG23_026123 [Scotinomys teguina]